MFSLSIKLYLMNFVIMFVWFMFNCILCIALTHMGVLIANKDYILKIGVTYTIGLLHEYW